MSAPSDEPNLGETNRIVITAGGVPTAEELAALVVALTPTTAAGQEPSSLHESGSAWREASLLEGVGFRPFVSVDDVAAYHRSLA